MSIGKKRNKTDGERARIGMRGFRCFQDFCIWWGKMIHTVNSFVGVVADSLDMLTSIQARNIVWVGLPGRYFRQNILSI